MNWINVKDRLPEEKEYVLGYYERGNWIDIKHPVKVNYVIVRLVKGLSKEERALLPDDDENKRTQRFGDEIGNNRRPYRWVGAGPINHFGQDINWWMPLPDPLKEFEEFTCRSFGFSN